MKKSYKIHIAWLLLIITGFIIGIFSEKIISSGYFSVKRYFRTPTNTAGTFSYINQGNVVEGVSQKYVPFELKTSKRIFEEVEKINPDISLSIYVRNLNNGPWFGIHEEDKFASIGTLKMPLFLAYLKWSEQEQSAVLEKTHIVRKQGPETQGIYIPKNMLLEGEKYSVVQLLKEMMVSSNDLAAEILRENIPESYINLVYSELGMIAPGERQIQDNISLKEYSSFFRILYNAAYLTPKTSEFALSLLTATDFKEGIAKGVPKDVQVANKFGERIFSDELGVKSYQIHDCGVVYYENYPYMICISSRGNNENKLANTIGNTSKIVYEEISRAYPE